MNYMRNIIFGIYALVTFNASAMEYTDQKGNRRRIVYHQECSGGHRIHNRQIEYGVPQMGYFYADATYYANVNPAIYPPHLSQQEYFNRIQQNRQTVAQIQGLQIFSTEVADATPLNIQQTAPPTRSITRK